MGIRAPKQYDPKRETNFDAWLARVVFHMSVSKISDDKRTSSLLLLFDTDFSRQRVISVYKITPTLTLQKRSSKQISRSRKRERSSTKNTVFAAKKPAKRSNHSRAISSSSNTGPTREKTLSSWKTIIHVFICGLRNEQSNERVLLKSPKTHTEASQYARFAEAATRVTTHRSESSTTTTNAIHPRGVSYGDAKHKGGRNQHQQQQRNNWKRPPVAAWTRTTNRSKRKFSIEIQRFCQDTSTW